MSERTLEYDRAAENWLEALPLGNGRIGVMDWGSFPGRLSLNEESVWSGNPGSEEAQRRVDDDEARGLYMRAQRASLEGRMEDAERDLRAARVVTRRPIFPSAASSSMAARPRPLAAF